ncbi:MAG: sigma-70 family RNA polymerase sigma factor [Planctomycetota bacterium]|nr:sigma-70 family RNA polymerase sigma factor [Planctomycetota bacterium]
MELDELINAYRGPLIGLIAAWGAPWHEATEIAQDSFADAWLNRESCRGDWNDPEVFGRWLRGVALNRYRNWSRGRRRWFRLFTFAAEPMDPVDTSTLQEVPEHLAQLREAVDRLPQMQRQVILMHYLEDTSVKEVATLLSVPVKTVEGRLYQARRALHRMITDQTDSKTTETLP